MEERGYTVIRALGQGTCQSRVYEVQDRRGRLRVLKQLLWVGEDNRVNALREVRMLSSLRHPCIVPYLESFLIRSTPSMPSEDILCLVMSRCERDLRQECLRKRLEGEMENIVEDNCGDRLVHKEPHKGVRAVSAIARFDEHQVVSWFVQLSWGLEHLHSRKFLHRDLKPQNVLLTHGGQRALLSDFGVAGQVEHTEDMRRSIVGTPAFMSPEMLQGRPYGLKTDLWALGCVLFEMMSLEPPFSMCGESYAAVVGAILHAPPVKAPPGYSLALNEILEALLARKPHARPSTKELLRSSLLRGPFHAFVQSLEEIAAASQAASDQQANAGVAEQRSAMASPSFPELCNSAGLGEDVDAKEPSSSGSPRFAASLPEDSTSHHRSAESDRLTPLSSPSAPYSPSVSGWAWTANGSGPNSLAATARSTHGGGTFASFAPREREVAGMVDNRLPPRLVVENDNASYGSDFETFTEEQTEGESVPSPSRSPNRQRIQQQVEYAAPASVAPPSSRWDSSPSNSQVAGVARSEGSESSESCGADHQAAANGDMSMGDFSVAMHNNEWKQLLAEAEALLQPNDMDWLEEVTKVREALYQTLGNQGAVDRALGFLRERRPLGETMEADELVLQVELLDLLGDEGIGALPLLERLLALEARDYVGACSGYG
mmetsp:Transcript_5439/g.9469  ORF Transcript_5439/g.9469 Transcript_5439/m.9469 type:complete len:660 (-) Transcript_5439:2-1981(-)